jgi:hypothetical protein
MPNSFPFQERLVKVVCLPGEDTGVVARAEAGAHAGITRHETPAF